MNISDYILPGVFALVMVFALVKKRDVFADFTDGVMDGARTVIGIFPALFALVVSVGMLRASGGLDMLTGLLKPFTDMVGFPSEVTPLVLIRPFSGSGSTAVYESILKEYGADSFAGLVASVVNGSSETLFYVIAIYFGAGKIKRTRYTIPAALTGDFCVFLLSAFAVKLLV
ncbi:MAG: spore maturation protein [Oscillospiraceae bacterium]|jgi:spore maturation protein B|nr:spore maturation protein [Oscillospiraceae bacterium]